MLGVVGIVGAEAALGAPSGGTTGFT